MSQLKSFKRLITKDFKPEDQEMIEQLGRTVNDAFNELYFAANGRLSLSENLFCTVKLIDVTVNENGVPINSTTFTLDRQSPVIGIQVIYAVNQTNTAIYPVGQPFISFTPITNGILINHISGLQANQRYSIRIIAWH
jgi:hypothetical protein